MKAIGAFNTKGTISRKVTGKKSNGKSYLPDVLKDQLPAILKAMNESVARQTKRNFFDTKVTFLYDNLMNMNIENAETSINFDIDGHNKSDGNIADLDDIFDEISYKTIKADVNKVLKNGVKVLDVYDGGSLGSIIEFKVAKPKKVTSSLKQKASENPIYQLIDYDGDTILTHTLVGKEHIIKNASGKVVARLPLNEDGSDFAYNKIVLGDKVGIAEILGAIINNSFVSNKIIIKER